MCLGFLFVTIHTMKGKLYIVATPIGNLGDISSRALDILHSVAKIYAEDTRVTNKLLKNFDIQTSTQSFHAHSSQLKFDLILKDLIDGKNIALVTDAGTPGVSDPGNELVDYLFSREPDLQIRSIPGPSAVTTALSMCGFNVNKFLFLGFLPKKKLNKSLEIIKNSEVAVIYFDSVHRALKNLEKLSGVLEGTRRVFVAREITKLHETHYRGSIAQVLAQLKEEKNLKGELVVVVES